MALTHEQLRPLLPVMSQWAVECYPTEACGLILERESRLEALCCDNMQDRLNAVDPERYPRNGRTAYNIDPLVVLKAQQSGASIRGVFHSHPDRGAYFSAEDRLGALGGDESGNPVLPGVDYVVLAAHPEGVDEARLYVWSDSARDFVQQGEGF
jgi:proteasome lid subunit RPN8/RPN11